MAFSTDLELNSIKIMVQDSPYTEMSTQDATTRIIQEYNQSRESIMTTGHNWLFQHRLVKPNEFRLVEKNGIPELVGNWPVPQRRKKILNFSDSSSTLGIYEQKSELIGVNGHYLVNVPPGKFAKIFDGNKAILLASGQHVIHSNNFQFDPKKDLVSQTSDYIFHNDLHILRVPQGKVAIVRIDNETMFLEHRKEPYLFRKQQFHLIKPENYELFHNSDSKILRAGTQIRLLPDAGEIAVFSASGQFQIIRPKENEFGPILKDIGNARFDGFLPTTLENVEFPSEAVRQQHLDLGIPKENSNFDYFYTADQIQVGVRFLVNYRITDAEKALKALKLGGIRGHIESVVAADMGNAIKKTSVQDLLSSDLSKIDDKENKEGKKPFAGFNHWQDTVKTKLKDDLAEYGIELVRLNIEESKILNSEIDKQMAQQAISYTKAHAQKLSLKANLEVGEAQAEQKRVLDSLAKQNEAQILQIEAASKVKIAQLNAEALKISTDAEVYNQNEKAKVLANSPQAMLISFLKEFREALANGHFSSALPLSDLANIMATFMAQITQVVSGKPAAANDSLAKGPGFFPRPEVGEDAKHTTPTPAPIAI